MNTRKAALPTLPSHDYGDGYEWMSMLATTGWTPTANWGQDGWDLGEWPLVIVCECEPKPGMFGVAIYVEGDITTNIFTTPEDRDRFIDETAAYHWRLDPQRHPDVPPVGPLQIRRTGRFSWSRLES